MENVKLSNEELENVLKSIGEISKEIEQQKEFENNRKLNVEFTAEELSYILKCLYDKKISLNLVGIEEEQNSEEYQINQGLRGRIEREIQNT